MLVGGSGLYVQAVLDELEFPGTDPELRAELEAELAAAGPGARCTPGWPTVDPAAAAVVLPANGRRIVRALEVIALTGRPFPARLPEPRPCRATTRCCSGVDRDTAELDARIARRVARMFAAGLVDETRGAAARACATGATASAGAGLPAGARRPRRRGDLRPAPPPTTVRGDPPVRPPAALLVPPRPARSHWLDGGRPDLLDAGAAPLAEPAIDRAARRLR